MPIRTFPRNESPPCPNFGMNMISISGLKLDPERRTFECLRCGHLEVPQTEQRIQAAG